MVQRIPLIMCYVKNPSYFRVLILNEMPDNINDCPFILDFEEKMEEEGLLSQLTASH